MSRYLIILLLFFFFSGLNAQKRDSLKLSGKTIEKQDSVKAGSKNIQKSIAVKEKSKTFQVPDSVRFSPKIPPGAVKVNQVKIVSSKQGFIKARGKEHRKTDSVKVYIQVFNVPGQTARKPKIVYPPDSIRFSPKVPPQKAVPVPVNIISRKQGLVKKPVKGVVKHDSVKVYIKVQRKQDATAFLTYVAPNEPPVSSLRLVHDHKGLVVPPWLIAQRKAALEAQKKAAQMKLDSAKAPKPRIIKQWNLSKDFSEEVPTEFDTTFTLFNRYRVTDIYSPVNAYLGNYGLPYYSLNFFDRIYDPDKFLYSNLYHFMHTSESALFMNLQVPFTELKWILSGEKATAEQTFRIKHSQNINRFLNFGLVYDIIFNLGQYTSQRSEDKTFTFYTSYTRSRYKLYFSVGLNGLLGQENGGITNMKELNIKIANTRDIPVKLGTLNGAKSFLRNRNFLVVQRFTFIGAQPDNDTVPKVKPEPAPFTGTFSHIFQLDYTRRTYSDASPKSGFYDSIYINNKFTFDSLSAKIIKNTFRVDFNSAESKSVRLGGGFGFRNELFWFSQTIPVNMIVNVDSAGWYLRNVASYQRSNNVILGNLLNNLGRNFWWRVNGELSVGTYRKGDYSLNGEISRSFDLKKGRLDWLITGEISKRTPSFWYTQWGSNNFRWNLDPEKESRLEFGTRVSYPARKADLRFNYAIINNYMDFDTLALPSQDTSRLTVMSLSIRKDFRAWKFHLLPDIILQKSSNKEVLDLPLATIKAAAYIEHMFWFEKTHGRLYTQLGVDVTYHTLYHPYNYMPATGRYFRQEQSETGAYPFVNAFLNIKLKRTRFFLMFDHLNYGMMKGDKLYNYELVPLYPLTTRRFAFGLAWTFYN